MGDEWTNDLDRETWERYRRRAETHGRSPEGRSFQAEGARRGGPDRDRVFGERETGADYGPPSNEMYGYPSPGGQGGYGGGRYYGDDDTQRIYREEYGQGGVEYGEVPRGYDAQREAGRGRSAYDRGGYGQSGYGYYPGERSRRMAAGGTGGYDYERGYGDGGRRDAERQQRTQHFEDAGRGAGDFLHRAGERVASWFGAGEARSHRGRGPQGYSRSDERISEDAHERLTEDHYLDASRVTVAVSGGEVTLGGVVDSREAKRHAERIVEEISGVRHVQNNLRIDRDGGSDSSDTVLGQQIRDADPAANGTGGVGGGQSTAGRKS
jgi:osmotically-inducible protein OsmY